MALLFFLPPALAQQPPAAQLAVCMACHGPQGNSQISTTPSLAGQPKVFLENKLVLIREGLREIPKMKGLLDGVSDADIVALATYFSAQTRATVTGPFVTRCEILNQTARECRARLVAPIRLLQI